MIHPDGRFYYRINGDVFNFPEEVTKHAGKEIEPTEEPFATQWAEQIATQYQRDRQAEYLAIADQLDQQYWDKVNGTSLWEDGVKAVKTKYPKSS